ncbi:hypothetical protein PM082_000238 [Marasmius tenuissimus]|nr:hypothetical protein PM082_000238 [Marasmius tenuissimus]
MGNSSNVSGDVPRLPSQLPPVVDSTENEEPGKREPKRMYLILSWNFSSTGDVERDEDAAQGHKEIATLQY